MYLRECAIMNKGFSEISNVETLRNNKDIHTPIPSFIGETQQEVQDYKVAYQKGREDNKVALMFSCPGQEELRKGEVCAGQTGKNTEYFIACLHKIRPDIFQYPDKADYLITNASDKVHYMELTGDTEASDKELYAPDNIERVRKELEGKDIVICFGDKAEKVIHEANPEVTVITIPYHLGNQRLNRAFPNSMFETELTPTERCKQRINMVADILIDQL